MVNPDCARSTLEKMWQIEGESVAQYHVRLRLQVTKCSFADPDDVILSKILRDKKLRREAMVKGYTVTGKFTDFPVCVIRNIFIRKLSHLTISSPFILINQKMHKKKTTVAFE